MGFTGAYTGVFTGTNTGIVIGKYTSLNSLETES